MHWKYGGSLCDYKGDLANQAICKIVDFQQKGLPQGTGSLYVICDTCESVLPLLLLERSKV
jgi:hypothetical protein